MSLKYESASEPLHKSMSLKYEPSSEPLHISIPRALVVGVEDEGVCQTVERHERDLNGPYVVLTRTIYGA